MTSTFPDTGVALCQARAAYAPAWWYIGFDQTEYWNIPSALKGFVKRILTVYLVDFDSVTHCCDITASRFCIGLDHVVEFNDVVADDVRNEINEIVAREHVEDAYMRAKDVDAVISSNDPTRCFRIVRLPAEDDQADLIDALSEAWRCNPKF